MPAVRVSPIEKLRRIWTPGREVEEVIASLEPQSELDSMIRDLLHRVIEQTGPKTVTFGTEMNPRLNTGTLRWEIIHHVPQAGVHGHKEISIWVEGAENGR